MWKGLQCHGSNCGFEWCFFSRILVAFFLQILIQRISYIHCVSNVRYGLEKHFFICARVCMCVGVGVEVLAPRGVCKRRHAREEQRMALGSQFSPSTVSHLSSSLLCCDIQAWKFKQMLQFSALCHHEWVLRLKMRAVLSVFLCEIWRSNLDLQPHPLPTEPSLNSTSFSV